MGQLFDGRGLILERAGGLDHDKDGTGDQIIRFQYPIRQSLRSKVEKLEVSAREGGSWSGGSFKSANPLAALSP